MGIEKCNTIVMHTYILNIGYILFNMFYQLYWNPPSINRCRYLHVVQWIPEMEIHYITHTILVVPIQTTMHCTITCNPQDTEANITIKAMQFFKLHIVTEIDFEGWTKQRTMGRLTHIIAQIWYPSYFSGMWYLHILYS